MNDLISRQAAISEIVGMTTMGVEELVIAGDKEKYDWIKGLSDSLIKIINLPSVESERKTDKWTKPNNESYWRCSECGSKFTTPWGFCPHCGSYNKVDNKEDKK